MAVHVRFIISMPLDDYCVCWVAAPVDCIYSSRRTYKITVAQNNKYQQLTDSVCYVVSTSLKTSEVVEYGCVLISDNILTCALRMLSLCYGVKANSK